MKKVKIEIRNRWTGNVLFEYEKEDNTLKETVVEAVKKGANLKGAYLEGADLEGAYLFLWDDEELNINEVISKLEENTNIRIKRPYINKHVLSPYWLTYWKNGLIIDEYEIVEPEQEPKKMTVSEICKELGYDVEIIKENN